MTDCGLLVAPVALTGTETGAGLVVSVPGLTVNVTVVLPETAHVNHAAGLAGHETVPSDPPPLFVTVTVWGAGIEAPRITWKTSDPCESAMRGTAACASVTVIVFETLSLGATTTTGKMYVPGASPDGSTVNVSTPDAWLTVHATRAFAGVGTQVTVPRFDSVPAPVLVTVTEADDGFVPPPFSDAAKLTAAALSVSTG